MTAFSGQVFLSQHDNYTEQVKELQLAIQEGKSKLVEVRQKRQRAEEEANQWRAEVGRRLDLIMGKDEVVTALTHLGHLLQEEKHLSEQLNGQASADRNQGNDLQENLEHITNKARSLATEIQVLKGHLAEAQARNMAAQALIKAPTSKSKRNQSKPK